MKVLKHYKAECKCGNTVKLRVQTSKGDHGGKWIKSRCCNEIVYGEFDSGAK